MSSINLRTLANMRGQIGRFVGDTTASRNTKTDEWINTHYADVAERYRWPQLMRAKEGGVVTAAGERFLYLPKDVGQLYFLIRGTPLGENPHQTIEKFFLRLLDQATTQGRFITYADVGELGRRTEFSTTPEVLTIQNVGAQNGELASVLVHGQVALSGTELVEVAETVDLTGTSAQNTSNTYTDFLQASIAGTQTGTITVTGQNSGTLYASIEPGEETARYKKLRVGYVSDGETLTMYYKKAVRRLTDDLSIPEIPVSHVLIEFVIGSMFMLERKWQGAGTAHMQLGEQFLMNAISSVETQPGRIQQAIPLVSQSRGGRNDTIVVSNG